MVRKSRTAPKSPFESVGNAKEYIRVVLETYGKKDIKEQLKDAARLAKVVDKLYHMGKAIGTGAGLIGMMRESGIIKKKTPVMGSIDREKLKGTIFSESLTKEKRSLLEKIKDVATNTIEAILGNPDDDSILSQFDTTLESTKRPELIKVETKVDESGKEGIVSITDLLEGQTAGPNRSRLVSTIANRAWELLSKNKDNILGVGSDKLFDDNAERLVTIDKAKYDMSGLFKSLKQFLKVDRTKKKYGVTKANTIDQIKKMLAEDYDQAEDIALMVPDDGPVPPPSIDIALDVILKGWDGDTDGKTWTDYISSKFREYNKGKSDENRIVKKNLGISGKELAEMFGEKLEGIVDIPKLRKAMMSIIKGKGKNEDMEGDEGKIEAVENDDDDEDIFYDAESAPRGALETEEDLRKMEEEQEERFQKMLRGEDKDKEVIVTEDPPAKRTFFDIGNGPTIGFSSTEYPFVGQPEIDVDNFIINNRQPMQTELNSKRYRRILDFT